MGNTAPARPAQFDPSTQRRRSLLAKINIGRQSLNMDEDDYRQLLLSETGKLSLKDCSEPQLVRVVEALKAKGFRPLPNASQRKAAQQPMAVKARALWISLYHLGVVHNPGEPALEAFAKRQLGCERMVWARDSDSFRLIEALKAMATREGWALVDHKGVAYGPLGLQASLCEAIVAKMKAAGVIPDDWTLPIAAYRLCGIETAQERPFSAEQHASLAANLGGKLREMTGGRR